MPMTNDCSSALEKTFHGVTNKSLLFGVFTFLSIVQETNPSSEDWQASLGPQAAVSWSSSLEW